MSVPCRKASEPPPGVLPPAEDSFLPQPSGQRHFGPSRSPSDGSTRRGARDEAGLLSAGVHGAHRWVLLPCSGNRLLPALWGQEGIFPHGILARFHRSFSPSSVAWSTAPYQGFGLALCTRPLPAALAAPRRHWCLVTLWLSFFLPELGKRQRAQSLALLPCAQLWWLAQSSLGLEGLQA